MKLHSHAYRRHGAALVIVLVLVVLLTGLVLAYFSRALLSRQISNSSANETKSDLLARSAMDVIVGDLKQEIANGSIATTNGSTVIYTPTSSTNMVPRPSGTPNGGTVPNLIRRSVSSDAIAAPGVASRASAINSATNASPNGRAISAARWNSHYLIPRFAGGTNTDSTPDTTVNFVAPDWVLVTRGGPSVQTAIGTGPSALNNPDPSNQNYVIGRYAYAIYSEGGLLDVNVAGYPSGLTPAQIGAKGTIALADLTRLPVVKTPAAATDYLTQNQVDQIVGWRNYHTAQPGGAFGNFTFTAANAGNWLTNFVQSNTTGFLTVAGGAANRTDQAFLSRQALIKLVRSLNISPNVLQYLGTFSRELNAPSWTPLANASALGGKNDGTDNTGETITDAYAYKDNADKATAVNRKLFNVRVTVPFTRLDGTLAIVGEPLLKNRFDLNNVAWIAKGGTLPAGITAADIYNYFGLTRDSGSGSWVYNHGGVGGGTRIMTLEEVAQAGREPDFFELLQAGILQGSLGLVSGDPANAGDEKKGGEYNRAVQIANNKSVFLVRSEAPSFELVYAQGKYQIMQIGANIIDQADADSFPTEVVLNYQSFYGIENLPYLNAVGQVALRPPEGSPITPNTSQTYVHQWLTFGLWNPHQNAGIPNPTGPTSIRIRSDHGVFYPKVQNTPQIIHTPGQYEDVMDFSQMTNDGTSDMGPWVALNISDYANRFSEPTAIDYDRSSVSSSNTRGKVKTPLGWKRAGIYMGSSYAPDVKVPANAGAPYIYTGSNVYDAAQIIFSEPMVLKLEYQDPTTLNWHTYEQFNGLLVREGRGDPYFEPNDPAWGTITVTWNGGGPLADDQEGYVFGVADPRAVRFNIQGRRNYRLAQNFSSSDAETGAMVGPHFTGNVNLVKTWVNNLRTSNPSYTDRDFVNRLGDSAGWTGADPQIGGNLSQRPLILDRPFRNVGELGYVFRDDPWKSLNLFSASNPANTTSPSSADSALLDIFCIGSSPAGNRPPPGIVAGKVNVNSAATPVLAALMTGAVRDYLQTDPTKVNTTMSLTDSQDIAIALAAKVKATPFSSIAELPAVFPQDTSVSGTKFPGDAELREAAIRGLADGLGTRTWNLLIDIIAQSGKYGPGATKLSDFIVEGEKRYWLHVAIDRFTGQVVDQQLELVSE